MMPVERWRTSAVGRSERAATASPIAAWSASPAAPGRGVGAARRRHDRPRVAGRGRRRRPSPGGWPATARTGAAANRLGVNTAAAGTGPSSATISTRSGRPDALMPAVAPAARNPAGRCAARSTGGRSTRHAAASERVGRERHGASGQLQQAGRLGQAVDDVERLDRLAGGALDEVVEHADGEDPARCARRAGTRRGPRCCPGRASSPARPR